jgi:acyl carrier protein
MSQTKDKVLNTVIEVFCKVFRVKEQDVAPETPIFWTFDVSYVEYLDFIFRLEVAFSINIDRTKIVPKEIVLALGEGHKGIELAP